METRETCAARYIEKSLRVAEVSSDVTIRDLIEA